MGLHEPRAAALFDVVGDDFADHFLERHRSAGNLTQSGDGRFIVAIDGRFATAGELPRTLGRQDDQGKSIGNFFQTVFDGYAGHRTPCKEDSKRAASPGEARR